MKDLTKYKEEDWKGNKIRFVLVDEEEWYAVGNDVASALGYSRVGDALSSHVAKKDMRSLSYKASHTKYALWSGNDYSNKILINQGGMKSLVSSSNLPNAIELCRYLGIEIGYNNVRKEQSTLYQIMQAFSGEDMQRQYPVSRGKYIIDLYFPEYRLAIECDEYGHIDRPIGYDEDRQQYIENELGCHFIRYNPDSEDFSIFKVINKIIKYIYNNNKGVE